MKRIYVIAVISGFGCFIKIKNSTNIGGGAIMEMGIQANDRKRPNHYSILVLDQYQVNIEGMKRILEQESGSHFHVCGAMDLNQAVQEMRCRFFDCVLVDLLYPEVLKAITKISHCSPDSRILVITNEDPAPYFNQMIQAGAVGFISKSSSPEQLVGILLAAIEGRMYVPVHLIRELRRTVLYIKHPGGVKCEEISEREEKVLKYLALGYTYGEIAAQMYVSQRTIENLVSNLCKKFNVSSRKGVIDKAREFKLLPKSMVI